MVYAPTLTAEDDKKKEFHGDLDAVLRSGNNREKTVLLGDLNARVGRRSDLWEAIGPHDVGKINSNGLRLLSLHSEHRLVITNTLFCNKNIVDAPTL